LAKVRGVKFGQLQVVDSVHLVADVNWGKDKLVVLLHGEGFDCSTSTVGRIFHKLKERGVLKEPVPKHISARKRQRKRPYAIRKPKGYEVSRTGDLVQLDTLDIRPLPGVLLKHFTTHDVISRWNDYYINVKSLPEQNGSYSRPS